VLQEWRGSVACGGHSLLFNSWCSSNLHDWPPRNLGKTRVRFLGQESVTGRGAAVFFSATAEWRSSIR
jgi:hypothetical protein